jgi:hypothetical protein
MPLFNPAVSQPPPLPERVSLLDRARQHPAVATVTIALGIMAALGVIKSFVTETAPWLVAFVGPLAPTVADAAPIAAAGFVGGGIFLWLDRESQRQQREITRIAGEARQLRRDLERKTDPSEIAREQARRERFGSKTRR